VSGGLFVVASSSCRRRRCRVSLDAFSWQMVGWLSTVRRVDGEATRQMSSSGQVQQDASSECWGVRLRRRVIVVSSSSSSLCGSRCLFVADGRMALDASRESTARRQDKCLLLGRSGKKHRASNGGFVRLVVLSSCCRVALDAFSWQVAGWLLSSEKKISGTEKKNSDASFFKRNSYSTLRKILTQARALNLYIRKNSQTSVGEFRDWLIRFGTLICILIQ
jgi:hypothetical protein